jgi:hydroxymethylpyrimidine/phosphomethylpyrimidine kinase
VLAGLQLPQRFAVKAGMLATLEIAREFQMFCTRHGVRAVVDPLHRSTSGASMWPGQDDAEVRAFLLQEVLPHAAVATPNWLELEWLSGKALPDLASALAALRDLPCPGVLKGGHAPEPWRGIDHVWDGATLTALEPHGSTLTWRSQARGTGCRFATDLAITLLSHETSLAQAARHAKRTVHALLHGDPGDQGL